MNLFIYETARPNTHDSIEEYKGVTPLCKDEIKQFFNVVSDPNEADYFYMGQISCGTLEEVQKTEFNFLDKFPSKHIVTIEGDWAGKELPDWLKQCICVGNAAKVHYTDTHFCVRPCMSKFLVELGKKRVEYNLTNPKKQFGFVGQLDPHGTRIKMARAIFTNNIPNNITINNQWLGSVDPKSNAVDNFINTLQSSIFSLCPRGAGEDTIRFYESTYFGRIPIIIGKCKVMGEDYFDNSFFYRMDPDLSQEEMFDNLQDIYNTDNSVLVEKCKLAKQYFNEVVVEYFKSPTKFFIDFLQRHKL